MWQPTKNMLELYVLLSILGLGYTLHRTGASGDAVPQAAAEALEAEEAAAAAVAPGGRPYVGGLMLQEAEAAARAEADRRFEAARDPARSGMVGPAALAEGGRQKGRGGDQRIASLSGDRMAREEFTHNNMQPFFGGRNRHAGGDHAGRLARHTGRGEGDLRPSKRECFSMFDATADVSVGAPELAPERGARDALRGRAGEDFRSLARNNELPFAQSREAPLGPGLDAAEVVRPKTVDELRVAGDERVTYDARVLPGLRGRARPNLGATARNRPETSYANSAARWTTTTGAVLRGAARGEVVPRAGDGKRASVHAPYSGTAGAGGRGAATAPDAAHAPPRARVPSEQYARILANPALAAYGRGPAGDGLARAGIRVYDNERSNTTATTQVWHGNVVSMIKAVAAPVLDAVRPRQDAIKHPRMFGGLQSQAPSKQALGTDDVARTTVKETTVHDTRAGQLAGHVLSTVYDPATLVARTTVKETTVHDTRTGNIGASGAERLAVYDPAEVARTTIRETLDALEAERNVAGGARRGQVYNDTPLQATLREMLSEVVDASGHLDGGTRASYRANVDAKATARHALADHDYFGIAAGEDEAPGAGYLTAPTDVRDTARHTLSQHDYFGAGGGGPEVARQMAYDDAYQYQTTTHREAIDGGARAPAPEGAKVASGVLHADTRTGRGAPGPGVLALQRGVVGSPDARQARASGPGDLTKSAGRGRASDRLDGTLLAPLADNPLVGGQAPCWGDTPQPQAI